MPKLSWRHHYIPEFYLKNFTNSEGKFYIFLLKENRYKENGKLFSPRQSFFEQHGNTLFIGNDSLDFLETNHYKKIDNDVARLFHKIKYSNEKRYGLTEADMPIIQFFIAHLFWRNPINEEFVKILLRTKGLSGLGLKIKDSQTHEIITDSDLEKEMIKNGSTYKLIKFWLPLVLYKNLFQNNSSLTILKFEPGNKPSLISDNPLILRNPKSLDVYGDDFILPLSSDKILIRTKKLKEQYQNQMIVQLDHLLLRQANSFIATTDLKYIPLLQFVEKDKSTDDLREGIFKNFVDE